MSELFTGEQIIIKTVDLTSLINKVQELTAIVTKDRFIEKLDLLSDGEIVTSKVIKRLMGWSEKVFQNRLRTCEPHLPMIKNNESRWEITKEDFLNWFEKYKAIKY